MLAQLLITNTSGKVYNLKGTQVGHSNMVYKNGAWIIGTDCSERPSIVTLNTQPYILIEFTTGVVLGTITTSGAITKFTAAPTKPAHISVSLKASDPYYPNFPNHNESRLPNESNLPRRWFLEIS